MGLRVIPHRYDWRLILPIVLAPVLLGPVLGLGWPFTQLSRSSEENGAMVATPAPIDGQRSYGYLKKICEIGPRVAGSEANTRQRQMVADHFTKLGGKVREQHFRIPHPLTGRDVNMANLIGSWHPDRLQRVLICAHYDTRPRADEEVDPARLDKPFIGANDGASGVALLMEIAHHLDKLETPYGVDLVLFDGEELVYGNNPRRGDYFLGSTVFARAYAAQRGRPRMQYVGGILLDMVGGKEMQIKREPNSLDRAPELMREVWAVARQLDARSFSNEIGREVMDDHLPLNQAGIPTIDLIDFDYPHWHKIDDVPENCSAESLAEVGRVVTGWLSQPRRGRR
jgi:glutaminyl-peptide cyclotransferase